MLRLIPEQNKVRGIRIHETSLATRFPLETESDSWSDSSLQQRRDDEIVYGIADLGY